MKVIIFRWMMAISLALLAIAVQFQQVKGCGGGGYGACGKGGGGYGGCGGGKCEKEKYKGYEKKEKHKKCEKKEKSCGKYDKCEKKKEKSCCKYDQCEKKEEKCEKKKKCHSCDNDSCGKKEKACKSVRHSGSPYDTDPIVARSPDTGRFAHLIYRGENAPARYVEAQEPLYVPARLINLESGAPLIVDYSRPAIIGNPSKRSRLKALFKS